MHWTAVDSVNVNLPDGIRLYSGRNDSLPLRAWYVTIDEKRPEIFSKVVVSDDPEDGRESVSSFAHDLGATVVVNGGYFTMGQTPARHVGLLVSDGSLISTATDSALRDSVWYVTARAAVGFSGMDEIDISWAAVRNDTVFSLPAPPPNRSGNPTSRIDFSNAYIWKVRDAIGAGPTLIMDGKIRITSDEEVFFGSSIPKTHPRTAVGYTQNGVLILMVVDGRQVVSRGVDLEELA
ncbi:MAG: phosphodiester glycosidase family protein, partial [bacterium]